MTPICSQPEINAGKIIWCDRICHILNKRFFEKSSKRRLCITFLVSIFNLIDLFNIWLPFDNSFYSWILNRLLMEENAVAFQKNEIGVWWGDSADQGPWSTNLAQCTKFDLRHSHNDGGREQLHKHVIQPLHISIDMPTKSHANHSYCHKSLYK